MKNNKSDDMVSLRGPVSFNTVIVFLFLLLLLLHFALVFLPTVFFLFLFLFLLDHPYSIHKMDTWADR